MRYVSFVIILVLIVSCGNTPQKKTDNKESKKIEIQVPSFDKDSAYSYVEQQVKFGPRVPGTQAHSDCLDYLQNKLNIFGATTRIQIGKSKLYDGKDITIKNIIGSFNPDAKNRVLLCAHWDSRPFADQDKDKNKHKTPILGANDGASGVGILLEVARNLYKLPSNIGIDIIFFDVEDYGTPYFYKGDRNEDTWCLGSKYWAQNPHKDDYQAEYGILLDMVGGKGAKFYQEYFSKKYASHIVEKVWNKAINSGFDGFFISKRGGQIIDDHLPINEIRKIPTIDIIQYDINSDNGFNEHWHTSDDNMSNIDRNTLYVVGQTILNVIFDI